MRICDAAARLAVVRRHLHARHAALEQLVGVRDDADVRLIGVDGRDRAGDRLAPLSAVSGDDHVAEHGGLRRRATKSAVTVPPAVTVTGCEPARRSRCGSRGPAAGRAADRLMVYVPSFRVSAPAVVPTTRTLTETSGCCDAESTTRPGDDTRPGLRRERRCKQEAAQHRGERTSSDCHSSSSKGTMVFAPTLAS